MTIFERWRLGHDHGCLFANWGKTMAFQNECMEQMASGTSGFASALHLLFLSLCLGLLYMSRAALYPRVARLNTFRLRGVF